MWIVLGLLDMVYLLMPRIMNAPGALEDPILSAEVRRFIVRGLGAIEGSDEQASQESVRPWQPPVVTPNIRSDAEA